MLPIGGWLQYWQPINITSNKHLVLLIWREKLWLFCYIFNIYKLLNTIGKDQSHANLINGRAAIAFKPYYLVSDIRLLFPNQYPVNYNRVISGIQQTTIQHILLGIFIHTIQHTIHWFSQYVIWYAQGVIGYTEWESTVPLVFFAGSLHVVYGTEVPLECAFLPVFSTLLVFVLPHDALKMKRKSNQVSISLHYNKTLLLQHGIPHKTFLVSPSVAKEHQLKSAGNSSYNIIHHWGHQN